jgi:hypothetical protein
MDVRVRREEGKKGRWWEARRRKRWDEKKE